MTGSSAAEPGSSDPVAPKLSPATMRLTLIAVVLGAATGAAAVVTFLGMIALQEVIWSRALDYRWLILPLTILGGALIGWTRSQAAGAEIESQIATARSPERAQLCETVWIALGAILAVGFGGAIGPEAGIVAVTAHLSSIVALRLGKTASEQRFLAEAGISGALSGVYGSPAGGPMHSSEDGRAPKPILFAAGLAGFASFVILADLLRPGALEMMRLPRFSADVSGWDVVIALLPALAGALAGTLFLLLKHQSSTLLGTRAPSKFWQPVLGGAALGIICTVSPLLLFSGHAELGEILHIGREHGPMPLILLALGKALACAICVAAGWRGGVIFPMCFAGGALGAAMLFLVPGVDPVLGVAAGMAAAASVGMTRPLVAALIMLFILGGGLAVPVLVGTLVGWWALALLPDRLTNSSYPHAP